METDIVIFLLLVIGVFSVLVIGVFLVAAPFVRWAAASGVIRGIRESGGDPADRSAREILDERYARGEIGREEYAKMLEDLQSSEYQGVLRDFEDSR